MKNINIFSKKRIFLKNNETYTPKGTINTPLPNASANFCAVEISLRWKGVKIICLTGVIADKSVRNLNNTNQYKINHW